MRKSASGTTVMGVRWARSWDVARESTLFLLDAGGPALDDAAR